MSKPKCEKARVDPRRWSVWFKHRQALPAEGRGHEVLFEQLHAGKAGELVCLSVLRQEGIPEEEQVRREGQGDGGGEGDTITLRVRMVDVKREYEDQEQTSEGDYTVTDSEVVGEHRINLNLLLSN